MPALLALFAAITAAPQAKQDCSMYASGMLPPPAHCTRPGSQTPRRTEGRYDPETRRFNGCRVSFTDAAASSLQRRRDALGPAPAGSDAYSARFLTTWVFQTSGPRRCEYLVHAVEHLAW